MKALAAAAALVFALQGRAQSGPQAFSLPNGLRVILLEDHERPLVRARLHVPLDRPSGALRPGLALLARRVLDRPEAGGLKTRDFERIQEGAGIRLGLSLQPDGLDWTLLARSRDQDLALGLLADRVLRPLFDPSTLEAQRSACWREREEAPPPARLRQALEPAQILQVPALESLATLTYEDLLDFRARVIRPDRAVLVLHGDLGKEQAKRLVLLSFGTWTVSSAPPASTPSAPAAPPPAAGPVRIAAPGAPALALAAAPVPEPSDPESTALLALLLAHDPALHPIRLEIEAAGLVAALEPEGPASAAEAEAALRTRLEARRQLGYGEADLQRAKAAWRAHRALSSLHPEALMGEALDEALGRAVSPERLRALSLDALNQTLRRWLDPARLRTGALADARR